MKINPGIVVGGLLIGCLLAVTASAEYSQTTHELNYPSVSADGKIIAFYSQSTNWGYGGLNSAYKVFVYHRERHKVLNICKNGPYYANSYCENPRISADGKQVVYEADADNLIGGINTNYYVTNNTVNIYACAIEEGDFSAPAPGFTHKLINVSAEGAQANRGGEYAVCSSNARYVAFQTKAWNLGPVDTNYDQNNIYSGMDIYLRDRDYDGNGVFDEEGATKTRTLRVSHDTDSSTPHCAWYPSISADGQTIAYVMKRTTEGDRPGHAIGVCVYKLADDSVSVYAPGYLNYTYEPRLSPDGTYMAAQSWSSWSTTRTIMYTLPDTNYWYAALPRNTNIGIYAYACEVSTGGHYMVYTSSNTNLVEGDTNHKNDVFVRVATGDPRTAQYTELVSKSTEGVLGDDDSGGDSEYGLHYADITWDGRYVVFLSAASNLVAVDTNAVADIFIRDRLSNTTEIVAQKVGSPVFPAGAALTVSQVGDTSAFFQWTAATDEYTIWEYQLTLAASSGSTQFTVNGASTSYSATGLIPGTDYTATLEAYDGGGNHTGNPLSASFTTTGFGPLITANGMVENVYLNSGDPVTIAVQMINMDSYAGVGVDWWIVAFAHSGAWYYLDNAMQWMSFSGNLASCRPVYQGGLFNLSSTPVLTGFTLPSGIYDFWFAIDAPMDGILDLNGQVLYDNVTIAVQ